MEGLSSSLTEPGAGAAGDARARVLAVGRVSAAARSGYAGFCRHGAADRVGGILAPQIAPFDPFKESIIGRLKPFGWRGHLLGTDELGRDMLSRLIYGGRVSLLMGVVPVLIASLIGGLFGVVGGFLGGRMNTAIMRTMDVFYAFPSVLLAVAIAGAMGGGMANGMLALTLVFIPPMCRSRRRRRRKCARSTSSRRHAPAARAR